MVSLYQNQYEMEPEFYGPPGARRSLSGGTVATTTSVPPPTAPVVAPSTGGNLPPLQTTMTTGGNQPPLVYTAPPTGGNTPPGVIPLAPTMSTPHPPQLAVSTAPPMSQPLPPLSLTQIPSLDAIRGQDFVATTGEFIPGSGTAPADIVRQMMSTILDQGGRYIQDARLRGQEFAAERGLLNSSIAAGAAEREALQAAQPMLQQAMGLHGQREQLNFQGQQNQLNRVQNINDALLASRLAERQSFLQQNFAQQNAVLDAQLRQRLQSDQTAQADWLADRNFSRQFNATISMLPINSAFDMNRMIQQYALENPEIYTPTVISGMTNFFQQNMLSILSRYFPNMIQSGGG